MRKYLLALLLTLAPPAYAHASCWVGPNLPYTGTVPASLNSTSQLWAAWYCPTPTPMVRVFLFNWQEAAPWVAQWQAGTLDAAGADANLAATGKALTPAERAFVRTIHVDYFGFIPKALSLPAYKQRQAPGAVSFVQVGTVPVGTACTRPGGSPARAGDFMLVPRDAVRMASTVDPKPLVTWAKCG